jgi:hypothetical protein
MGLSGPEAESHVSMGDFVNRGARYSICSVHALPGSPMYIARAPLAQPALALTPAAADDAAGDACGAHGYLAIAGCMEQRWALGRLMSCKSKERLQLAQPARAACNWARH